MTVSNKRLKLALALFVIDEVTASAIPFFGTSTSVAASCQKTTSVAYGDDCTAIAKRCNISNDALHEFNLDDNFCSTLRTGQIVCCGKGILSRSPANDSQESDDPNEDPGDSDGDSSDASGVDQGSSADGQGSEGSDQGSNSNDHDANSDDDPWDSDGTSQQGDGNGDGGKDGDNNEDGGKTGGGKDGDNNNKNNGKDDSDPDADLIPSPRTGNWTKINCNDRAVRDQSLSPEQQWAQFGAAAAFKDAVDHYTNVDRANRVSLTASIIKNFEGVELFTCEKLSDGPCSKPADCPQYSQKGTGPAAMLIHNSFVNIHTFYTQTENAINRAHDFFDPSMDSFINSFAPVPPAKDDNAWLDFFIDIATMGAAAGLGNIIKEGIKGFSSLAHAVDHNEVKAAAESLLVGAMSNMKEMHENRTSLGVWNDGKQKDLKAVFGTIFRRWSLTNEASLEAVFADDDASISRLGNLINSGKMLGNNNGTADREKDRDRVYRFGATMFATAAPQAWRLSNNLAFIIDMQAKCDQKDVDYKKNGIDEHTFADGRACVDEKLYYLAMVPNGASESCPMNSGNLCNKKENICWGDKKCYPNLFTLPPGIELLDGKHDEFANVKVQDIMKGSVLSYTRNGNKNGAKPVDITNADTFLGMADDSTSVPGVYRLPICTSDIAYKNWKNGKRTDDNYPC